MMKEKPKAWWMNPQYRDINSRRAVEALTWVRLHPGKTAWELASVSGIIYAEISKGLQKGREHGLFRVESEDRNQGGVRYRYWPSEEAESIVGVWREQGKLTEPAGA